MALAMRALASGASGNFGASRSAAVDALEVQVARRERLLQRLLSVLGG